MNREQQPAGPAPPAAYKVLLINQAEILHYRVPVYNHLAAYLDARGYALRVAADGVQADNPHPIAFSHALGCLRAGSLFRLVKQWRPDAIIFWVNLRHGYLFPVLVLARALGIKVIYWGHGGDLLNPGGWVKRATYALQHALSDAIILYAPHLRRHVRKANHGKVFIANNTLVLPDLPVESKEKVLRRHGIATPRNIICMGRLQARKRLQDLLAAYALLDRDRIGLILVGPDPEGMLATVVHPHIYKLGPIYGPDKWALLQAADVYCLPGAVGLSIVDAFHCALPFVTEMGDESAERMYLEDGINGFEVPRGDIRGLASKLQALLEDDALRARFASAARRTIETRGHIDVMCEGFHAALRFVRGGGVGVPGAEVGTQAALKHC